MTAREIILDGGCPWGFRMHGGADVGHALRISRVNPGSKAAQKGVREGDVITSINGQQTKSLTNGESHALLRTVENTLRLGLNEDTNGSPKRKSKETTKRDTAGSSTQSVNTIPAAVPSSTTVVDITVDSTAPSSSNSKGKKSKSRQNQEQIEKKSKSIQEFQDSETSKTNATETEANYKLSGMSSSKARRLRKARLNNKKKSDQDILPEELKKVKTQDSDTLVNGAQLTKEEFSEQIGSATEDLVEILVVIDSEDIKKLDLGTVETLTELPDLVKDECKAVNELLDKSAEKRLIGTGNITSPVKNENIQNKFENESEVTKSNNSLTRGDLNSATKLTNNKSVDSQSRVEYFSRNDLNDNPATISLPQTNSKDFTEPEDSKSVQTIKTVEPEISTHNSKVCINESVLPEKEDIILLENTTTLGGSKTEKMKEKIANAKDCVLCKEKRASSDGKKVAFTISDTVSEKTSSSMSVSSDLSQEQDSCNKKLTCKMGVLPKQQCVSQSVMVKTTITSEETTSKTNEVVMRNSPVCVFVHPPDNLADITDAPRLSWDSVSDIESTSSHTQFSSSDDEIHSDMLVFFPSNEISSSKIVVDYATEAQLDEYDLCVQDLRDPLIAPEEEKQLRQFLKTSELTKPEEFDDSSSSKSHEESSVTSGSETDSEVVVYKHIRSRSIPETCYIPADRRRHLEVITEETSDPSDTERITDLNRPWENSAIIRHNNEIHGIPNDWFGSDEDFIETSDDDGIDTSWGNGTKLEDVEGVEVVYLGENSEEDEEIMLRTFKESLSKRNNSLAQPELVVVHEVDLNDVRNTVEVCKVEDHNENEEKKNKVQEIIDILNHTYEINRDSFEKYIPKEEDLKKTAAQQVEYEKDKDEEMILKDSEPRINESFDSNPLSILCSFDDHKYKENRIKEDNATDICRDECPEPQEKFDATTPPPTLSRQGSSSSGTGSQSTAKYYPGQSPMSSESEDKTENDGNDTLFSRKKKFIQNPKTLKRLAENAVVSLPNGSYFLEQIGFYSQDKPFQVNHEGYKLAHLPPSGVSTRRSSSNQELENITSQSFPLKNSPFNSPPGSVVMLSSPPSSCLPSSPPVLEDDQWVGMPTSVDPRLLVCLSPSQSKTKAMPTPKEASGLLDLHKKFMERRGYHEQFKRNSFSPKSEKSSTPDFTNSPDLLRLDSLDSDKSGFYTPELLTEAASLLALKQYRQSRFKQDNSCLELNVETPKQYESEVETRGGITSCESDLEGEEQWRELEAIRCGEITNNSKQYIFKPSATINMSCNKNSVPHSQYNLERTAKFVKTLNDTEKYQQESVYTDNAFDKNIINNVQIQESDETKFEYYRTNPNDINVNVIKEEAIGTDMTSPSTEINLHCDDPDVNRSTGSSTSRLLAIIQSTDAPSFSGFDDLRNNTVPLEMNCVENSAGKLQNFEQNRKFIGNHFISSWLTMSQNVGTNPKMNFKNVNENRSVTNDENAFSFTESDFFGKGSEDFNPNNAYLRQFEADKYKISKQGDIAVMNLDYSDNQKVGTRRDRPKSLPPLRTPTPTGGELFRQKMYQEYMDKVAERSERRQQKVIKISDRPASMYSKVDDSENIGLTFVDTHKLENEFMGRVKERMNKLGIPIDDDDDRIDEHQQKEQVHFPEDIHVCVGDKEADVSNLPKHLQEFLELTLAPPTENHETTTGVWSPVGTPEAQRKEFNFKDAQKEETEKKPEETGEPAPVIWTPRSAGASPTLEKKSFKPVNFESPTPSRKVYTSQNFQEEPKPPTDLPVTLEWKNDSGRTTTRAAVEHEVHSQSTTSRLVTSHSAPDTSIAGADTKLPRAQNPTITLLQKAREGQLPRGAHYLEEDIVVRDKDSKSPTVLPNEIIYSIRKEYESETEDKKPKKIVELGPRKFEGIGPTTKEGIPIVLRSEVKDVNQQKWYKRMYDSLHKAERDKDSVTVRYKTRRGRYPYTSPGGYLSEPEHLGGGYDSDYISSKYATLDRRRIRNKENDFTTSTMPRNKGYGNAVKHAVDVYKNQPGRIEDYEPGNSSIADVETKQWWDEVMDIFDGQFEQTQKSAPRPQNIPSTRSTKPYMTYALKESGYESDSTLVFKRRDEQQQQLSPAEQKNIYKTIQKGGEVPLHGLRKLAPERPKEPILGRHIPATQRENYSKDRQQESPHRYVESEVTIHYRSPIRAEEKEAWSEEELQRRQAEAMRRIYQEERRRKYLLELQDMYSRRHTDNFTPSQKSPIPLNRYDDFLDDLSPTKPRDRTPEPKLVARALYNFVGQTSRELSFRRGDIIYVRRQIDKNWYEGEHNAMIGLFPFNYVEIIPYDGIRTIPKKPSEGQARAKFNFQAQTHLELPLVKGELVLLTRRVDENWYEGRIGNRKGIFPASYVDILVEPGERTLSPVRISPSSIKPVASPASHSLHVSNNMSQHHYQPPRPVSYTSLPRAKLVKPDPPPVNQTLHIDTQNEPVPYRVLYNYKPQNEDELELNEGETVYVMEKCDDGWYVGSSQRTGYLGTFPGNYVERIV